MILKNKSGGEILVSALRAQGVDTVFSLPGESFLPVLDAFYDVRDDIRLITCRQEGGAAYMAEAYGKLTGKAGICFVSRGPGACNASIGVHTAYQDSTPMILFVGQVDRAYADREAFQEIDYRRMYGQMSKWVAQIDNATRIPEYVNRAFHIANNGRPGPVVLVLPRDVISSVVDAQATRHYKRISIYPGADDLDKFKTMLSAAQKPLLILGGSGWSKKSCRQMQSFAENNCLPVTNSFRCQDLFDNTHDYYVGDLGININPKLIDFVQDSDLIIAVGPRLGTLTTKGYTLLDVPVPKQKLIHIHSSIDELEQVYQPEFAINATMESFAESIKDIKIKQCSKWQTRIKQARDDYETWVAPQTGVGEINLLGFYAYLRETLSSDTIITNGAGNYAVWLNRYYQYKEFRTQLAPTNGSMGYGIPAAVAAKLVHPDRTVVSFSGDGCFLMNSQEITTAIQYNLPIIYLVFNNNMYGTIRVHQERDYPERVSGTDLVNPDFVAYGKAFGIDAERVEDLETFKVVFDKAVKTNRSMLIEIPFDPLALSKH